MKNSLYATLLTGNPHDAGLVDAWLDERIASSASVDLPDEITSTRQDNRRLAKAVTADEYDGNIAPGQIRILSKRFTAYPKAVRISKSVKLVATILSGLQSVLIDPLIMRYKTR